MAKEKALEQETNSSTEASVTRVYEAGYHIVPTAKEDAVEAVVASVRSVIEKSGGSFIAEGAPQLVKLAYSIDVRERERFVAYDRAFFGWIKFEAPATAAQAVEEALRTNTSIMRSIVFKTVREDTRVQIKTIGLREVKRGDTIKAAPKQAQQEGEATPVSDEAIEKAIDEIVEA